MSIASTPMTPGAPGAPGAPRPSAAQAGRSGVDWDAVRAVMGKDLRAVRRSRAVMLPMIIVPTLMLVVLPALIGFGAANAGEVNTDRFMDALPSAISGPLLHEAPKERLIILVLGYLLAPLFLIVPLMVSAVLAADAFAGEKERRTLETVLHLPIADRDLFLAKVATGFLPAVAVSWLGYVFFCFVANGVAWPVMHRAFLPNRLWTVMIIWVAPAVAGVGLGVMVRVSAWARTTQEANQLGGAVILPIIFAAMGQATGLLLVDVQVSLIIGAVMWAIAVLLIVHGARSFTRDRLASRS